MTQYNHNDNNIKPVLLSGKYINDDEGHTDYTSMLQCASLSPEHNLSLSIAAVNASPLSPLHSITLSPPCVPPIIWRFIQSRHLIALGKNFEFYETVYTVKLLGQTSLLPTDNLRFSSNDNFCNVTDDRLFLGASWWSLCQRLKVNPIGLWQCGSWRTIGVFIFE